MGAGYDGMGGREWGNAKAQGRNEKQAGAKGYGTVSDAMGCSASEKMFLR